MTISSRLTGWDSQPGGTGSAVAVGSGQQVGLGLAAPCLHHGQPLRVLLRLGRRSGQHPVAGKQLVDLARHLKLGAGQHDEVIGDPLKLGHLV